MTRRASRQRSQQQGRQPTRNADTLIRNGLRPRILLSPLLTTDLGKPGLSWNASVPARPTSSQA